MQPRLNLSPLIRALGFVIALATITIPYGPAYADSFLSKRARFSIELDHISTNLKIITTTTLPSSTISINTTGQASSSSGKLTKSAKGWLWTAPTKPGLSQITFSKNNETITLNIFALTPFENGNQTELAGYKIGTYRKTLFKSLKEYAAPKGFINLAHGPANLKISPHFTLGQFICKQQPGHDPTYLLITPATLIKLETLLEASNSKGWRADTLTVMSGFRTPSYNASIGNKTTSSRHLYGGAADIYIDHDGNGRMDDLNGDGVINKNDARALAALAEILAKEGRKNWPKGGLGIYGANSAHGPFIHVDTRGYRARWGH